MGSDRSVDKRMATLLDDVTCASYGLHLSEEKLTEIEESAAYALVFLDYQDALDDRKAVRALCEMIKPFLTRLIHGRDVCTCSTGPYSESKITVRTHNKRSA